MNFVLAGSRALPALHKLNAHWKAIVLHGPIKVPSNFLSDFVCVRFATHLH
jgi:hypothetical protein